jgi:DNA replication protein DnaC
MFEFGDGAIAGLLSFIGCRAGSVGLWHGYVPLADVGAEFLFQVISDRAEKTALIVTTNLPFSEWTTVFPNPRLCKALLDRVTDRAHIIETGTESFRFRRTMEKRQKKR